MDGTRETYWKVLRHELILVNGLENPIVTHGTVLHTHKDEDLEANETDIEHALHTPEVQWNEHEAAVWEAEPQPTQESHTSPS